MVRAKGDVANAILIKCYSQVKCKLRTVIKTCKALRMYTATAANVIPAVKGVVWFSKPNSLLEHSELKGGFLIGTIID